MADAAARAAYLSSVCGADVALRAQVEELLQANETAGNFLITPADRTGAGPSTAAEAPGDRIGRYQLKERIGEGGCGIVYLAEQLEPVRRPVAFKLIKLEMDTRRSSRASKPNARSWL